MADDRFETREAEESDEDASGPAMSVRGVGNPLDVENPTALPEPVAPWTALTERSLRN